MRLYLKIICIVIFLTIQTVNATVILEWSWSVDSLWNKVSINTINNLSYSNRTYSIPSITASMKAIYIKAKWIVANWASTIINSFKNSYKNQDWTYKSGFIRSDFYWNFYVHNWSPVKMVDSNSQCDNSWWTKYNFSWTLYNEIWEFDLDNTSYFCWKTSKFYMKLIWKNTKNVNFAIIELSGNNLNNNSENNLLINSRTIDISWKIVNTQKDIDDIEISKDDLSKKWYIVSNWVKIELLELKKTIDKNIFNFTKNLTKFSSLDKIEKLDQDIWNWYYYLNWEKIYYFKKDNWDILKLWNGSNILNVNWKNILILEWWNLYIKSDIKYSNDNKDLLSIVVKKVNWKWWNIYIDPYVTNIDAILFADWSVMSYYDDKIISAKTNPENLFRQLLIYWSIYSKNTVWINNNSIPVWADWYSTSNKINDDMKYNLSYLRNFRIWKVSQIDDKSWCSFTHLQNNLIVSVTPDSDANDSITLEKSAFAWKSECYHLQPSDKWLRLTKKLAPLVIEYNPQILINPPSFIIK